MSKRSMLISLLVVVVAFGIAGCKKKQPPVAPEVGAIAFTPEVMVFAGVKSQEDFTAALGSMVGKFAPQFAPMVTAQVPEAIRKALGVKNATWIDPKRPLKAVVLDWKKFPKSPLVLMIPFKDKGAYEGALPDGKSSGGGNDVRFAKPEGGEVFVNTLDDYAVFTEDANAFTAAKPFLEGPFAGYEFKELVDVQVSVANLRTSAAAELAMAKAELTRQMTRDQPVDFPGLTEILKQEIDLIMSFIDQTEIGRVVLRYDESDLVLRASIKVIEGQGLAKFVAGTKERKLDLYKALPPGGWIVGASNVDPTLFASWTKLGTDFWANLLKLDPAEKMRMDDLMKLVTDQFPGESAFYIGRDGDFPLRIISISAVKDGTVARDATYNLYGLLFAKMGAFAKGHIDEELRKMDRAAMLARRQAVPQRVGAPLEPTGIKDRIDDERLVLEKMKALNWTNFKAFSESVKPILAPYGFNLKVRSDMVGGLSVDAVELTMDYTRIPNLMSDPEAVAATRVIGNRLSLALGYDAKRMVATFGRDAVTDMSSVGGPGGGNALIESLLKRAETNAAMVVYLSLTELMKIVAQFVPDAASQAAALARAPGDVGAWFVLGGRGDRTLDMVIGVPISRLAALVPGGGLM